MHVTAVESTIRGRFPYSLVSDGQGGILMIEGPEMQASVCQPHRYTGTILFKIPGHSHRLTPR